MPTFFINWRVVRPLIICVLLISTTLSYLYYTYKPPAELYKDIFSSETQSSNKLIHNERGNKYVKFKQLQGAGFNNQAQEILLYHHLALQTSRIYVYQPLIWRPRGEKAEVPLSAFLPGVTDNSISDSVFDEVCPPAEVVHVNLRVNHMDQWNYAKNVLSRKDRCIIVDDWVFNWLFLESAGTHAIWPSFQKYLSNHFKWSDYILDVVNRTQTQLQLSSNSSSSPVGDPYMAVHLRRGDFEVHCQYLGETRKGFMAWGTLPQVQEAIFPPALDNYNGTSVMEHCYPTLYRILDAVTHQAKNRPHLRTLHIIHDGAWDHPLVYLQFYKLAEALKNKGWAKEQEWQSGPMLRVTQSASTPIKQGERDWSVCVDVEMARQAEVFIGNGYSSLSTQVMALRLADGGKMEDITLI